MFFMYLRTCDSLVVCFITFVPCNAATILSGTDDDDAKNLEDCTGECDSDDQCLPGLKCFQRSNGEPIPGCKGAGKLCFWISVQTLSGARVGVDWKSVSLCFSLFF